MKTLLSIIIFLCSANFYSQNIEQKEDLLGLILKEIKPSRCFESGKVSILITVNSVGLVIDAQPVNGEEKNSKCLVEEAIQHARNLQFRPNKGAPEIQTTKVVYDIKSGKK